MSVLALSPLAVGWLAATLLWVLLFVNNTFRAPLFASGFDAPAHADYIQYILDHRALPLASDGWEMHQPPLYYLLAAGLLKVGGFSAGDEGAAVVFRLLGLACGLATLALVAASLGLLFPNQPRRQLVGLLLAAVLPGHLYTAHYLTNEALLIPLGAASLYVCLRILGDDNPSVGRHALLGLCLGAALLTKITALVVAGSVLLVLAGRLLARGESRPAAWLRGVGVTLLVTVGVCGWHYGRVWAHYGTPLVGNFDAASGFWWWQPPGFGTSAYLFGFGRALTDPFFSALHSLPDGLYSTFWGDGLCGGVGAWSHRPPWNYDLMAAGYLLALLPTLGIAVGLGIAVWRLVRRPSAEWFLLLGVVGGLTVALLFQFLRYPYHGHGRASYLLTGLLPACALGALGLDALARPCRAAAALVLVLLCTWGCTAYASFWIDPEAPATQNWAGELCLRTESVFQARVLFRQAITADPRALPPRLNLVRALLTTNDRAEARRVIEGVLRDAPDDPDALLLLAAVCRAEGRPGEGLAPLRRAAELAPDHPAVFPLLGGALAARHQEDEAIAAYREGLRVVPWDATVHANLALLLARAGRSEEAIGQYRSALALVPDLSEWLADLAWVLATADDPRVRAPDEALRLAARACRLTEDRDATARRSLAAALAACGRYAEARDVAARAAASREELDSYAAGKPFYARGPLREGTYEALTTEATPRTAPPG